MTAHIHDGGKEIQRITQALTSEHFAFLVGKPGRRYCAYHTHTEYKDPITLIRSPLRDSVQILAGHLEERDVSQNIRY